MKNSALAAATLLALTFTSATAEGGRSECGMQKASLARLKAGTNMSVRPRHYGVPACFRADAPATSRCAVRSAELTA